VPTATAALGGISSDRRLLRKDLAAATLMDLLRAQRRPPGEISATRLSELTLGRPSSRMVGTSGRSGERVSEVTASAFTAPDRMCASETGDVEQGRIDRAGSRSLVAGRPPR
jgi:hypothetical protein